MSRIRNVKFCNTLKNNKKCESIIFSNTSETVREALFLEM